MAKKKQTAKTVLLLAAAIVGVWYYMRSREMVASAQKGRPQHMVGAPPGMLEQFYGGGSATQYPGVLDERSPEAVAATGDDPVVAERFAEPSYSEDWFDSGMEESDETPTFEITPDFIVIDQPRKTAPPPKFTDAMLNLLSPGQRGQIEVIDRIYEESGGTHWAPSHPIAQQIHQGALATIAAAAHARPGGKGGGGNNNQNNNQNRGGGNNNQNNNNQNRGGGNNNQNNNQQNNDRPRRRNR